MATLQTKVAAPNGLKTVPAEQLATFAFYVGQKQFRFQVTRVAGCPPCVTHRASGKRVCDVPLHTLLHGSSDWKSAGQSAMQQLLARHGETRVETVLSAAERRS